MRQLVVGRKEKTITELEKREAYIFIERVKKKKGRTTERQKPDIE